MKRRIAIKFLAAGGGLLGARALFAQEKLAFDHRYAAWDALLKRHVVWLPGELQSRVKYADLARDKAALDAVLASWSALPADRFAAFSREQRMAFLINAYNGFTLALVLTRYPGLDSIKDLGSLLQSPWKKKFFSLLGQERHLDWIEHEELRARYRDPRIHAALVCASIGCPALRNEAFTAERLEAQLDDGLRRFLADSTRNRYANGRLEVSQIFKWFREDFEKGDQGFHRLDDLWARYAAVLGRTAAEQARLKAGGVPLGYLDYDWKLNDAARP